MIPHKPRIDDYVPELYDLRMTDLDHDDIAWYVGLAGTHGGPVLELGAGTGRVSLAIARVGVTVHALDRDCAMLEELLRQAQAAPDLGGLIKPVRGDLRTFDLEDRFNLVIAPFRVLLYNRSEEQLLSCLQRVYAHLVPGGTFAFNVFNPSIEYFAANIGALTGVWRWTGLHEFHDGGLVCCSEANGYDTVRQQVTTLRRYEVMDSGGWIRSQRIQRFELGFFHAGDLRRALEVSGFVDVDVRGGFDGRDFARDTDELVISAVRPPARIRAASR